VQSFTTLDPGSRRIGERPIAERLAYAVMRTRRTSLDSYALRGGPRVAQHPER
jgi:hypothetical protein